MPNDASWVILDTLFNNSHGNYDEILQYDNGKKYLKLRVVSKKARIKQIAEKYQIPKVSNMKIPKALESLFNTLSEKQIEDFIREQFQRERSISKEEENELVNQLKKMQTNDWGGVKINQLEFHIVDKYVKKINNYEKMKLLLDSEIKPTLENWSLSNWYSFWSNKLIENLINEHQNVLPGIGEIRHIDFFWNDIPFDLKTTKLAQGYIEIKRVEMNLPSEIHSLQNYATTNNIEFDKNNTEGQIKIELLNKLKNGTSSDKNFLATNIFDVRKQILDNAIQNPEELAIWNYENQSEKRFGDENRLYLILVDKNTTEESWKLKRERDFIAEKVNGFLDDGPSAHLMTNLQFNYENKLHHANCCVLFIVEE